MITSWLFGIGVGKKGKRCPEIPSLVLNADFFFREVAKRCCQKEKSKISPPSSTRGGNIRNKKPSYQVYDRKQTTKAMQDDTGMLITKNSDYKKKKKQFSTGMMRIDKSWYWIPFTSIYCESGRRNEQISDRYVVMDIYNIKK